MDFHIVPWKFEGSSSVVRQFFIKPHRALEKNPRKPEERTLFVANIPPYCDVACLTRLFSRFGTVEKVFVHEAATTSVPEKPDSEFYKLRDEKPIHCYKVAYIIFGSSKSRDKVLRLSWMEKDPLVLSTPEHPVETGVSVWIREHKKPIPSLVDLKKEIDTYMEQYDAKVEAEKQSAKQTEGEADEEGWVTVTRGGKRKGVRQQDVMNETMGSAAKKRVSEKELLNFYRFQVSDGTTKQLTALRRKFEDDKQKVAQMKAARKFKPY